MAAVVTLKKIIQLSPPIEEINEWWAFIKCTENEYSGFIINMDKYQIFISSDKSNK